MRRSVRSVFVVALVSIVALGCVAATDEPEPLLAPLVDPGSVEEAGILAFLNDASTTFTLLDVDLGLDRRAAENLVAHRDGADGATGTADDRPFTSIDEVDAVSYVGSVALQAILSWASEHGWIQEHAGDRDAATLALVNDPETSFELLDVDVALDRRAAENILAGRPFATIAALDAVPYVGPAALDLLATYALANGYGEVEPPPPSGAPCAILSEYTEGQGNNNKAVEIYNCGEGALALASVGLCLVRDGATTCGSTALLGPGSLSAGDVWVACRTLEGTFSDPFVSLTSRCDQEIGSAANFNGDDRLVLFHDQDGDGALGAADPVLDTFGDPAVTPAEPIWADMTYRRCDLAPHAPGPFAVDDYFLGYTRHDHTHLGVPPSNDCGATAFQGEGEACLDTSRCVEGLHCYGIPSDGSSPYGQCVDPAPVPGEGERCDRWTPCVEGTICAGWTLWGEGTCVPEWMAGRFESDPPEPVTINEAPFGGAGSQVIVQGLASVPVDIEVVVHLEHARPTDLRVTLTDPNGTVAVLWDRSAELAEWSRSFVPSGISRDEAVNGRWTLRIEDLVSGEVGVFHSWSLFIVSRWD